VQNLLKYELESDRFIAAEGLKVYRVHRLSIWASSRVMIIEANFSYESQHHGLRCWAISTKTLDVGRFQIKFGANRP
jgi:hypothetical protein